MELLRSYSKHGNRGKSTISLIEEVIRSEGRRQIPAEKRNKKSLPPRVRRLSDDEVHDLVEAYERGDSVYGLGRRFGIHRTTVSEHLHRAGIETRTRKPVALSAEQVWRAIALRSGGMSFSQIAAALEVTEYVVCRELNRLPQRPEAV